MPNFMITGTNFMNKGAQSMLFTCTEEIRSLFPDAKVYYKAAVSLGDRKLYSNYHFIPVFINDYSYKVALFKIKYIPSIIVGIIKSTLKCILKRGNKPFEIFELRKAAKDVDYFLDASGYCLTSKWGVDPHLEYYSNFQIAKKYDSQVILLPQSFGPFDYSKECIFLDELNMKYLNEALLVFAREYEGKKILETRYGLKNVEVSCDMVLTTDFLTEERVFKNKTSCINLPIVAKGSVGIIPNVRCLKNGNDNTIYSLYQKIIAFLLKSGKRVYLFRHSSEDLSFCEKLKGFYPDDERVVLITNDFNCFETAEFEKNFDFLIAARFHSIVHAFRVGTPCILLGWAVKYRELASIMNQEAYVFDITTDKINDEKILLALSDMVMKSEYESTVIKDRLNQLKKEKNCFKTLFEKIRV